MSLEGGPPLTHLSSTPATHGYHARLPTATHACASAPGALGTQAIASVVAKKLESGLKPSTLFGSDATKLQSSAKLFKAASRGGQCKACPPTPVECVGTICWR